MTFVLAGRILNTIATVKRAMEKEGFQKLKRMATIAENTGNNMRMYPLLRSAFVITIVSMTGLVSM